ERHQELERAPGGCARVQDLDGDARESLRGAAFRREWRAPQQAESQEASEVRELQHSRPNVLVRHGRIPSLIPPESVGPSGLGTSASATSRSSSRTGPSLPHATEM